MRLRAAIVASALSACLLGACEPPIPVGPGSQHAPVMVQVENISAARPQSGLQDAAVVYEYLTEGGISRFSAIYTSPSKGKVGPVRSARLVTISLAKIYGAVLVFSGGSSFIKSQIQSDGIPNFDENSANGALFRDPARAAPHNLYSDGSHLSNLVNSANASPVSYSLWDRTSPTSVSGGQPVQRFTVPVSNLETPTFTYDASASGWRRAESDTGAFVDADTNQQLVASTVIVQQVTITPSSEVVDVNGQTGVEHQITGSGKAQVFTAGHEFDATWSQGDSGPPSFSSSGKPAPIAPGLVWICLVATGSTAA